MLFDRNLRVRVKQQQTIGVIMGGPSAEREIALASGRRVFEALSLRGHRVVAIDWRGSDQNLWSDLRREFVDVAFLALHGTLGEDGCVQGLLECAGIPYTGSGVLSSALAMDKVASRRVFDEAGIETPRWTVYRGPADLARIGFPLVVKPSREGSSLGISLVRDEKQFQPALDVAGKLHGVVLIEEFVAGREIEVAVLDGEVLGDVEVHPPGEFYDYAAKYTHIGTQYLVPAPLSLAERQLCHDLARRAHSALGCAGVTRTDLLLSPTGRAVCLEVDTLPGLTDRSLLPKIALQAGLAFGDLCERILATASLKA